MLESKACRRYLVAPDRSTLTFEVKSTFHPVRGSADQLSGFIEAGWDDEGALVLDPQPQMHVEFSVERLRTGNGLQDREMRRMIDSVRFPTISAELRAIHPTPQRNRYSAHGDITLAGRVRRYSGEITVTRQGDDIGVDGELAVDIRDFGLRPPNLLIMKVEPIVTVRLRLAAASAG